MEENIKEEIKRLKEEIQKKKEKIKNISELVNKEIDREFRTNLWELSERELDFDMGVILSSLNEGIDPRPDKKAITSHRKIIGRFIVLAKKILIKILNLYTNSILEKQKKFNEELVQYQLASFIRFKETEKKIKSIQGMIKEFDEKQDIFMDQIKRIETKLEKLKS